MLNRIGDDAPSADDIERFGLYHSCQLTEGSFALFGTNFAARGRVGTSPLYWDGGTGEFFSFFRTAKTPTEFPVGHLFDKNQNRLVCWDSMYFDKPLDTQEDAVNRLRRLVKDSVNRLDGKTDAFLFTRDYGSMIVNMYADPEKWAYTAVAPVDTDTDEEDVISSQNMSVVCCDHFPAYMKKYHPNCKRLLSSLGCVELFDADPWRFKPEEFTPIGDEYLKYGLEIYSPFLDNSVVEYVLDMTTPKDRPELLKKLFQEEE